MTKPFEIHGVEAEKAEAMKRYNNQKGFRYITRAAAVAVLIYLWFPTVAISLLAAGDWFYRTGAVIVTNRAFVFVFLNLLVAFIFLLSRDRRDEDIGTSVSCTEPDLYDQYTSSSTAVIVTASDEHVVDDDDSKKQIVAVEVEEVIADKQIVPAFIAEVDEETNREAVTTGFNRIYKRTKSETKKKVIRPVKEFRRTESANSGIERLNSEEFRLKVEAFINEKKMSLVQEKNDVVELKEHTSSGLGLVGAVTGYGSC